MTDTFMFWAAQSVLIVGAILVAYVRTAVKLAVVESNTETLKSDHANLDRKVNGISRAVGRLEGKVHK